MKATVISFLAIILAAHLVSALDFSFSSPESVEINESFFVSIDAATSDIYDVKILVQNNDSGATISQIYNDGWRSPFYYLKSAFPDKKEFSNQVTNYSERAQICVKLRKSDTGSITSKCKTIEIKKSEKDNSEDDEDVDSPPEEVKTETVRNYSNDDFVPATDKKTEATVSEEVSSLQERIVLSPRESRFITKEEKILKYASYSFTLLTVIILIFLALRKI